MLVLTLNSAWMPTGTISWCDAIGDLFAGRAEVVDVYTDKTVRSGPDVVVPRTFEPLRTEQAGVWRVPSIIRFLTRAVFRQRGVKFNRHNVWRRDAGICQFCRAEVSRSEFTLDHVTPRSQGGKTRWTNVVVACLSCNHRKAARTPEQAKMRLTRPPVQPQHLPGQTSPVLVWSTDMPESWKSFAASVSYWHGKLEE